MSNEKFSILKLKKVKNNPEFSALYIHDFRVKEVPNADPSKALFNEVLEATQEFIDGEYVYQTYQEAFEERIESIPYYETHKVRKNAVYALNFITTYSSDYYEKGNVDIDKWKERQVQWFHEKFDIAPDGITNVKSVVYHGDETNPHCHIMVIPIDKRGRLNSFDFFKQCGFENMFDLQDQYAQAMEEFGLVRGAVNSVAANRDSLRSFYSDLNQITDIPQPLESESATEYHDRAVGQILDFAGAKLKEVKTTERNIREKLNKKQAESIELIQNEFETVQHELDMMQASIATAKKKKEDAEREYETLIERNIEYASQYIYDYLNGQDPSLGEGFQELWSKSQELISELNTNLSK